MQPRPKSPPLSIALSFLVFFSITVITFLRYPKSLPLFNPKNHHSTNLITSHDLDVLNSSKLLGQHCNVKPSFTRLLRPPSSMPLALRNYAKLHRQWRICLFEPQKCDNSTNKSPPSIILYHTERTRSGGLGDRLISIQTLFMIAVITQRLFLFNWQITQSHPYEITTALLPAYVDWTCSEQQMEMLKNRDDLDFLVAKLEVAYYGGIKHPIPNSSKEILFEDEDDFKLQLANYSFLSFESSHIHYTTITQYTRNSFAKQYIQGLENMTVLQLQRTIFDFLFRPSQVVDYLARRRTFWSFQDYVAVHARTGDDVYETTDGRFKGMHDKYENISKRLITCVKRADNKALRRMFIASDSLSFKNAFEKEAISEGYTVNTAKRYAWHVDKSVSEKFINSRDNCIAFFDIFADAYALSRARSLIFFPSGFPRMSMALGRDRPINWHQIKWDHELAPDECTSSNMTTEFEPYVFNGIKF